ncbi:hypothetical protein NLJ89_g9553 [Agrocybe chaxingu]|uniref:Carboxylic ester hydrolase n=1 Tax=Agrocybe chaxingu TaxID=84603 RepID=A0A9W8JZS6_9AGAR|nr:hypothetical protein NLJ89_g9553 [Agrocybe chaxingu]
MFSAARLTGFLALVITSTGAVPIWGQCGGTGYSGSTQCDSGLSCVKLNDWYSQCQTSATTAAPSLPPPATTTAGSPPSPATTSTATNPAATVPIPAGALTRITNFGTNPTNIGMYAYKPSNVKESPGLLVALHYCGGTAQAYFSGTQWRTLADQRGYVLLYGQAPSNGNCWDVTSAATLTHDAGGDSLGIASAVRYAIANWGVDPEKVFVVGTSSGAMMTNVLAGTYPDLFKGGAIFAGVALGCLTNSAPSFPPDPCANGQKIQTAQQWGDRARQAYPGYTGPYPKLQVWHGTADNVVNYANFQEELKQWTNVHGILQTPSATYASTPRQGYTKTVYGTGEVEGYSGQGAGHLLPDSGTEVTAIDFFGL